MSQPSFDALCRPLRPILYSKAMQLAREHETAQDLVQDALLHGFLAWDSFHVAEGEDPLDRACAWFHRILTNQFITNCRQRHRREELLSTSLPEVLEATLAGSDGRTSTESHGENEREMVVISQPAPTERLSKTVLRALGKLDPTTREIVERIDLHGEASGEIATELGMSSANVRKRLYRAHKRLHYQLRGPLVPGRLARPDE